MIDLDDIDKQIIALLQENARISNREIAKKVGLTASPTIERVKRLEREGVIKSYTAVLEKEKVGKGMTVFVKVTLSVHQMSLLDEFIEAIQGIPEILSCYHTTGQSDFLLHVVATDIADYEHLLRDKLTTLPDVQRLETTMVLRAIKEGGYIPTS